MSIISKLAPIAATTVLLVGFAAGAGAQTGFKAVRALLCVGAPVG